MCDRVEVKMTKTQIQNKILGFEKRIQDEQKRRRRTVQEIVQLHSNALRAYKETRMTITKLKQMKEV